jgi:hypothetical protein
MCIEHMCCACAQTHRVDVYPVLGWLCRLELGCVTTVAVACTRRVETERYVTRVNIHPEDGSSMFIRTFV